MDWAGHTGGAVGVANADAAAAVASETAELKADERHVCYKRGRVRGLVSCPTQESMRVRLNASIKTLAELYTIFKRYIG